MSTLPVIDVSSLTGANGPEQPIVAEQICRAFRDIGFVVVTGHGVPARLIEEVRVQTQTFFDRRIDQKMSLRIHTNNYRGYIPLNFFTPNASSKSPDGYEGYKLHAHIDIDHPVRAECSLYGPNRWPDDQPALRRAVQTYWQFCDRLATRLLQVLLERLGINARVARDAFQQPLTNMTLLHYPPRTQAQPPAGIHAHKDTDVLTVLAPDTSDSLQIRPHGSTSWRAVRIPEGGLVINIGDMLETWSGGYFVSTPHRVQHAGLKSRISFPYFFVPRHDALIVPLCKPMAGFEWAPITAGELSRKIWHSNWPDSPPIETCYDPGLTARPDG